MCALAKNIEPKSERCEDNNIFIKAAETCLKRLKYEVKNEGIIVKQFFSSAENKRQKDSLAQSAYNQKQASLRLARLLLLAKETALEIDTYFDHVYFPLDYELPSVNNGDRLKYILSVPCYGNTVKALDSIVNDTISIGRQILETKKTVDKFSKQLAESEHKLLNDNIQSLINGQNAPAEEVKGLGDRNSDISKQNRKEPKH